jgi:hypothetical protein
MKKLLILATLLLTGCQTTKLVPQIYCPAPPAEIMVPAKPLQQLQKPAPATGATNASGH